MTGETPAITVQAITAGKWRENCYVLHDDERNAVVIDPGDASDEIVGYIRSRALAVRAVVNTHGHYDHVAGVASLTRACPAPFYLHSRDRRILQHANLYRAVFDGHEMIEIPAVSGWLDELPALFQVGSMAIEVLETPGHTPGSVSLLIGRDLFSGDILFRGRVGRVDLPGGNRTELAASLRRLSSLGPDVRVHPGHGISTTIGDELASNADLREAIQ